MRQTCSHPNYCYGVDDLLAQYREAGLDVLHLPTIDRTAPSDISLETAMTWIGERVSSGKRVLIHCVGGLGKAGTVAGCWLKRQGLEGDAAIALVREFRSARAIETKEQEKVVRLF